MDKKEVIEALCSTSTSASSRALPLCHRRGRMHDCVRSGEVYFYFSVYASTGVGNSLTTGVGRTSGNTPLAS